MLNCGDVPRQARPSSALRGCNLSRIIELEDIICAECCCTNDCKNVSDDYHCPAFKIIAKVKDVLDLDRIMELIKEA